MTDDLSAALNGLNPSDRALLELSLQRGIEDEKLAGVLGTSPVELDRRRHELLATLARDLDTSPERVEAQLRERPPAGGRPRRDITEQDAAAAVHGGESHTERESESRAGFLRSNGLSIFFLVLFLAALAGQSYAGWRDYNATQRDHEEGTISYTRYVTSSEFGQAVSENWQSEYLQFVLYFMATIWLVQRGSPESKKWKDRGRESEAKQQMGAHARPDSPSLARREGGLARLLYSNSLLIWMGLIWVASWFAQSVTGWSAYNSGQLEHGENGTNWIGYIGSSDFWESTLQNWQSEFLAVGSMAIFAVYLRQRGSPESKPVGAPHDETAATG